MLCKHRTQEHLKYCFHGVSDVFAAMFLFFLLGLLGATYLIDSILPTPLSIEDEKIYKDAFISERARNDLKNLIDIGPRATGSMQNEIVAVNFLNDTVYKIRKKAHQSKQIEIDIQVVSGSYDSTWTALANDRFVYVNLQNVVVKLYGSGNSNHSLLINAHFDSVPISPGGSDDGINCAIMLEVLRKLSKSSKKLEHNVIFLFNGAEETGLQASHGFITQHKWAKEVKVFINLEAVGAGGKEILFQSGPKRPWLMRYYNKVPHPNAQAVSQEIFQGGFVPTDTDFRNFRDYGNAVGYDMAFYKDGYRYHTRFDRFSNIPLGSYQHMGDNLLSLVRNLANAPELASPDSEENATLIYFDFFGWFVVSYTESTAAILACVTCTVSLVTAIKCFVDFKIDSWKKMIRYTGFATGTIILGWIIAGFLVVVIALILNALQATLSWYINEWLVFGLYAAPVLAATCGSHVIFNYFNRSINASIFAQSQIQLHSTRLVWTLMLPILTCMRVLSGYIILLIVLCNTAGCLLIQIFCQRRSMQLCIVAYVLATVIPTLFIMRQVLLAMEFFLPMCGRTGLMVNPELVVAVLILLSTIMITSVYVPLITFISNSGRVIVGLLGVFMVFFVIVFTPTGFPFSGHDAYPAPQRILIYHTSRAHYNEMGSMVSNDSGYLVTTFDRIGKNSLTGIVKDLDSSPLTDFGCELFIFCGIPAPFSFLIRHLYDSTWIPAEDPIIGEPLYLNLTSKTKLGTNITRYNFTAGGPDRMNIYLSLTSKAKLVESNLIHAVANKATHAKSSTFYLSITSGKQTEPLNFYIDIQTIKASSDLEPVIHIAVAGSYIHENNNTYTPNFVQFLSEFPKWTDVTVYLGLYKSWMF